MTGGQHESRAMHRTEDARFLSRCPDDDAATRKSGLEGEFDVVLWMLLCGSHVGLAISDVTWYHLILFDIPAFYFIA